MAKVFTQQEQEELNKASNALNLDADSKKLAFAYFLEYKQKTKQTVVEKLSLMIGCSILSAAKSQVLTTVKGDTIRGVGISITQLLRGLDLSNRPANIEEFLMALKEFITVVTLSADITTELKGIIDKFAFSYTFFVKFNSLFKQLEIEQSLGEKEEDYISCLKNLGWLIYTNARTSILQNRTELVESVFLLASTLISILQNLPNNIPIPYLQKNGKSILISGTNEKNNEAIQEGVFELLKLTKASTDDVLAHQKLLQDLLKKFLENNVLTSTQGLSLQGLYDPQVIFSNFEKLDAHYQKKLGFDDLDERFFIRDRKAFQAGMFTPFAKQGPANKLSININITKNGDPGQSIQKIFPSQRVLNYEMSEPVTMKSNLNEIRSAGKAVPASPFSKIPPATPVTRALEMYNWLSDKVRIKKNGSGLTAALEGYLNAVEGKFKDEIVSRANTMVEKVLNYEKENASKSNTPLNEKKVNDRHNQMVSLYFKVLEELLSQEERKTKTPNFSEVLSNQNFHRALIACSIETVFFVNNSSNISFVKLLEICEIQAFEFWRIIGSFASFDPQIPFPIKKHLHSLELKILMHLAWKKDSLMHTIVKKFIAESNESAETESPTSLSENPSPGIQVSRQVAQLSLTTQKSSTSSFALNISSTTSSNSDSPTQKQPKTELTHSQELFFQRVLHHTALHIYQLSDLLGISEQISEQIWNVMKYALSTETTLLVDRHIDQIILSTVYGVCKVLHLPLKFQEIIAKYQELPSFDKNDFIENIHQVYINDTEKADLIKFYNQIYIPQMKTSLFSLAPQANQTQAQAKSATPQVKKPLVPALFMDSPLRKSLPNPAMAYKSISAHSKTAAPLPKYGMTPRTGALYAFGESPSRTLETINNLASKRQINFDDSHDNSNSTGDFIIKKTKTSNPILDKIIEQRGEDAEFETKLPAPKTNNPFESFPAQNSAINKFSTFSEPPKAQVSTLSFNFSSLKPIKTQASEQQDGESKMNVESEQNPQQSQSDSSSPSGGKSEQNGFKKVQKKDSPIIPELKN